MSVEANYLRDLGYLLRESALEAKQTVDSTSGVELEFARGRLLAFHEAISLVQQPAAAFQLPLEALSLAGIDPERDLL